MSEEQKIATEKTYLAVPFEEKDDAKASAGRLKDGSNALGFDDEHKLWYAKPGADLAKLNRWMPDTQKTQQNSRTDPVQEFGAALQAAGFELDGLPVMDGKKHRVKTTDDKRGQKSGVYAGFLDGVPAGWYQDHRTHPEPVKWKATGQEIDHEAQAHLKAVAAQRKVQKDAEQARQYAHNAKRSEQAYNLMPEATDSQAYLEKKGVKAFPGVRTDKRGRLVIPLKNENDEVRSLQRINGNSFKSLKKNAQKTGNYFVVGGELKNGEPILYAEGYSTSASISEATKRPVVMTVDAGNLPRVAEKLKLKYPDSPHVILGDDDRKREVNKGLKKAEEAAQLTDGVYTVPKFNQKEQEKGLTDFNDLHASRGLNAVRDQVEQAVAQAQVRKVETMSEKQEEQPTPVITESFEREIDAALSSSTRTELPRVQISEDANNWLNQNVQATRDLSDAKGLTEKIESQFAEGKTAKAVQKDLDKELEFLPVEERPEFVIQVRSSLGIPSQSTEEGKAEFEQWKHNRNERLKAEDASNEQPELEQSKRRNETRQADFEGSNTADVLTQMDQRQLEHELDEESSLGDENTVEPYVEQDKSKTAEADVKAWLALRRQSTEELLAKETAPGGLRPQVSAEAEPNAEIGKQKRPNAQATDEIFSEQTKFRPVVPEKVAKSYIEVDGKFYFQNRPDSLAFIDKGAKLQTKSNNAQVASSMIDIAEARGWTEVQLKGTEEFRREAWLQATSRGMQSHGYKPKEEDLARLKKLTNDRPINEVVSQAETVNAKASGNIERSHHAGSEQSSGQQPSPSRAPKTNSNKTPSVPEESPVDKFSGKLVEHGKAPYEHNADNKPSYFVTLENEDGKNRTTWGVDLERAMAKIDVKLGDKVQLENQGRKEVEVEAPIRDDKGKVIGHETINTYRNAWEVKAEAIRDKDRPTKQVLKEHPDLVNEVAAVKLAEKFSSTMNNKDQERFMEKVRSKMAEKVANGEQTPELRIKEERVTEHINTREKSREVIQER